MTEEKVKALVAEDDGRELRPETIKLLARLDDERSTEYAQRLAWAAEERSTR